MNSTLTPKDWELLSAYLDGQLTEAEKGRVLSLLAQRPDLGQGLDELRRTRAVLRAAPRRRAPRNFTLTPAMVQKPRPRWSLSWAPAFGFASALATILLVLSFFFQLTPLAQNAAYAPAAAPAPVYSQHENSALATAPVIIWNGSSQPDTVSGMGGGGPASSTAPNVASGSQPATGAPDLSAQSKTTETPPAGLMAIQASPETSQPAAGAAKSAATANNTPPSPQAAAPLAANAATTNAADGAAPANGPILGVAPTEQQGRMLAPNQETRDLYAPEPAQTFNNWTWVQGGLAAVALAFATAAVLFWRRARH